MTPNNEFLNGMFGDHYFPELERARGIIQKGEKCEICDVNVATTISGTATHEEGEWVMRAIALCPLCMVENNTGTPSWSGGS